MTFKKGDIVLIKGTQDGYTFNDLGVVVCVVSTMGNPYCVAVDNWDLGHSGPSLDVSIKNRWWFKENQLQLDKRTEVLNLLNDIWDLK